MFTRRHYEAVAGAMKFARPSEKLSSMGPEWNQWMSAVHELGVVFSADNVRFDDTRFFGACLEGSAK